METEQTVTRSQSVTNHSAVKTYALGTSHRRKNGKFTRVSEDFLNAVDADVEAFIRKLTATDSIHGPADECPGLTFVTKLAREKLEERLETVIRTIIFKRVMSHPSIGCTLKA